MNTYVLAKNLYANVYSSFIHNNQKVKTTEMSFSGQRIHTMHYYSIIIKKRNKIPIHATTWKILQSLMLNEKNPILKGDILYDSTYITPLK